MCIQYLIGFHQCHHILQVTAAASDNAASGKDLVWGVCSAIPGSGQLAHVQNVSSVSASTSTLHPGKVCVPFQLRAVIYFWRVKGGISQTYSSLLRLMGALWLAVRMRVYQAGDLGSSRCGLLALLSFLPAPRESLLIIIKR